MEYNLVQSEITSYNGLEKKVIEMVKVYESFAQRLRQAMDAAGLNQTELHEKAGIGKSAINAYLKGKYLPKQDKLYKIAKALNVPPSYLMGVTPPEVKVYNLTAIEREHVDLFRELRHEQQKFINELMESMIYKNKIYLDSLDPEERQQVEQDISDEKERYDYFSKLESPFRDSSD